MPDNKSSRESQLDKFLKEQRSQDLQSLIQQCKFNFLLFVKIFLAQLEYQARIGNDQPVGPVDRANKNQSLVEKVNVLAGVMNQIPDQKPERKKIPSKKKLNTGGPEEQRILIEELTKVLFLNNKDPKKVIFLSISFIYYSSIICNFGQPILILSLKNSEIFSILSHLLSQILLMKKKQAVS